MRAHKTLDLLAAVSAAVDWFVGSPWRYFVAIFLFSFAIRVNQLNEIDPRYLVPTTDWELSSIAISLVKTGQFADPYMLPSGLTAHLPPIYPAIFALIYSAFGLTSRGGYVGWLFIIGSGSLLFAMLPWFSEKLGTGKQAGFIGGVVGALWVLWAGHGEYLTAVVLGLLLVAFLRRWNGNRLSKGRSFFFGVAIGISFHLQPALLPVIVSCLLFELWWGRKRQKLLLVGLVVLGIVLSCVPWTWRNYEVFDGFIFVRSNLGLELRMGNHEGAAATMEVMDAGQEPLHPRTHFGEARKLRDLGELVYMRQAGREALRWIRTHPAEFLWLTIQRAANLWAGPLHRPLAASGVLALTIFAGWGFWRSMPRLTVPERAVFLIPLLTYPLIYYVVAYMPRYRVPIDWMLFILAGAAIWRLCCRTDGGDASLRPE